MNLLTYGHDAQLSIDNACEQTSLFEGHVYQNRTVATQPPENQAIQMQYEPGLIDAIQYQQEEQLSVLASLYRSVYSGLFTKEIVSTRAYLDRGSIYYHRGNIPKMLEYVIDRTRMIVSDIGSTQAYSDYLEYFSRTNLPYFDLNALSGMISFVIDYEILQILISVAKSLDLNVESSNVLGTIQKHSNEIKAKISHEANFLVMSPEVYDILTSPGPSKIADWRWNTANFTDFRSGFRRVGTLNSKFEVYIVPIMGNIILLGYNGNNWSKTGTVFVPNVLLTHSCQVPKYTFKVVRPEFYRKIILQDLGIPKLCSGV